jgi:hypothetical protein
MSVSVNGARIRIPSTVSLERGMTSYIARLSNRRSNLFSRVKPTRFLSVINAGRTPEWLGQRFGRVATRITLPIVNVPVRRPKARLAYLVCVGLVPSLSPRFAVVPGKEMRP